VTENLVLSTVEVSAVMKAIGSVEICPFLELWLLLARKHDELIVQTLTDCAARGSWVQLLNSWEKARGFSFLSYV